MSSKMAKTTKIKRPGQNSSNNPMVSVGIVKTVVVRSNSMVKGNKVNVKLPCSTSQRIKMQL
jgi:hypothetical protein